MVIIFLYLIVSIIIDHKNTEEEKIEVSRFIFKWAQHISSSGRIDAEKGMQEHV